MVVKIHQFEDREGFFSVTPHGSIDNETYHDFKQKITPILCESTHGILVDLKNVEYISSAGLGVLFSMKKFMALANGELVFCNLKPQIQKLFEIVKTLSKETMFKNYEEADHYFYTIMNQEIEKQKQVKKGHRNV